MADNDWMDEAQGIEPWTGAVLLGGGRCICLRGVVAGYDDPLWGHPDSARVPCRVEDAPPPDLRDADTLAAFDRRLALRLGAPEEAVREGVLFFRCPDEGSRCWEVVAGHHAWTVALTDDDFEIPDDSLLARVRAWKGA